MATKKQQAAKRGAPRKAQGGKTDQAAYSRRKNALLSDVGAIPAVKDPARRESCRFDLHRFLTLYFPASTGKAPFGEAQIRAIKRIELAAIHGGYFNNILPRGFVKSTIGEGAALWATLYGHRRFVVIFGASSDSAEQAIESIKRELQNNDLLAEDFPEVVIPIRALDNRPQRCAGQTHIPGNVAGAKVPATREPELTSIEWSADTIAFPSIALKAPKGKPSVYSENSGAAIVTRGLLSGVRGMKRKRADLDQQRPDFAIIDDPQTDESAASPSQCKKRIRVVTKNIMNLGGHGTRIAIVQNMTIIEAGDYADQFADRKQFPAWQTERVKMVPKMPSNRELWDEYAKIRTSFVDSIVGDEARAHHDATEFYRKNREAMDAGAEVSWEHCLSSGELSALQHAMNILIDRGRDVFDSECQNDPAPIVEGDGIQIVASEIKKRINGIPRGVVPNHCDLLTAFIDVQDECVALTVLGVQSAGFSSHLVDYGFWPDQRASYVTRRALRVPFSRKYSGDYGAQLMAALKDVGATYLDRDWKTESGNSITISRCLIDSGYEKSQQTVFNFCRLRPSQCLPSIGSTTPKMRRLLEVHSRKAKIGYQVGDAWLIQPSHGWRRASIDVNYWKSQARAALTMPLGSQSSCSLFGRDPEAVALFADHCAAEYSKTAEQDGFRFDQWAIKPSQPDNDFWDGITGAMVAASMIGARFDQSPVIRGASVVKKVSFANMQKQRATGK